MTTATVEDEATLAVLDHLALAPAGKQRDRTPAGTTVVGDADQRAMRPSIVPAESIGAANQQPSPVRAVLQLDPVPRAHQAAVAA